MYSSMEQELQLLSTQIEMRICVECRHIFSTLALPTGLCVYDYAMKLLPNLVI